MKLFCAALTAAPVTGDNSIVPIAIIAMAVVVVIAAVLLLTSRKKLVPPTHRLPRAGGLFLFRGGPFPPYTYITVSGREMQHLPGKFYAKVKKNRAIWQI